MEDRAYQKGSLLTGRTKEGVGHILAAFRNDWPQAAERDQRGERSWREIMVSDAIESARCHTIFLFTHTAACSRGNGPT
jgi:nitrate/TMAO reductase-like tetraheme cytochrome c subunit